MIDKKYLLLGVSLCMLNACNEPKSVTLEGSLDGIQTDSIYLYQVNNEHYGNVKLIESIAVTDGKFVYPADSIETGLYCFSLHSGSAWMAAQGALSGVSESRTALL